MFENNRIKENIHIFFFASFINKKQQKTKQEISQNHHGEC